MGDPIPFSDIEQLLPARMGIDKASLRTKVATLIALARAQWIALAQETFHSTVRDYVRGIQPVEWTGQTTAQVALVGSWPNALEQGRGPWDLRTTLLIPGKVRAVKRSKEGYLYLSVPFRHMGAKAADKRAMGRAYAATLGEQTARDLGRELGRRAKALSATLTSFAPDNQHAPTVWGGRLNTSDMGIPLLRPHHTTDIYDGMVRQEKTYEKATQSQYTTWRMITNNPASNRNNWMHPGIKAAGLATQVRQWLANEIPRVMGTNADDGG